MTDDRFKDTGSFHSLPAANPAYVTRGAAGEPLGGQDASAGRRVNGRIGG